MSSFLMNSGYSGVDPKFPPSDDYNQSSYLGSHSEYYNHMQAAQHYGYNATAAAAMSGYPNPRDPMGYSNYYQQCGGMTAQQVSIIMTKIHFLQRIANTKYQIINPIMKSPELH